MATYQREREDFLLTMQAEGMPAHVARRILRHANTIQRCATLECSSEAADRDRVLCPTAKHLRSAPLDATESCLCRDYGASDTATNRHGTIPRIAVTSANAEARITKLCAEIAENCANCGRLETYRPDHGCTSCGWLDDAEQRRVRGPRPIFVPHFQGDPRGACVKLSVPSGKTDDWGRTGICVPTRTY